MASEKQRLQRDMSALATQIDRLKEENLTLQKQLHEVEQTQATTLERLRERLRESDREKTKLSDECSKLRQSLRETETTVRSLTIPLSLSLVISHSHTLSH